LEIEELLWRTAPATGPQPRAYTPGHDDGVKMIYQGNLLVACYAGDPRPSAARAGNNSRVEI
jgi:hypothetical protein